MGSMINKFIDYHMNSMREDIVRAIMGNSRDCTIEIGYTVPKIQKSKLPSLLQNIGILKDVKELEITILRIRGYTDDPGQLTKEWSGDLNYRRFGNNKRQVAAALVLKDLIIDASLDFGNGKAHAVSLPISSISARVTLSMLLRIKDRVICVKVDDVLLSGAHAEKRPYIHIDFLKLVQLNKSMVPHELANKMLDRIGGTVFNTILDEFIGFTGIYDKLENFIGVLVRHLVGQHTLKYGYTISNQC